MAPAPGVRNMQIVEIILAGVDPADYPRNQKTLAARSAGPGATRTQFALP